MCGGQSIKTVTYWTVVSIFESMRFSRLPAWYKRLQQISLSEDFIATMLEPASDIFRTEGEQSKGDPCASAAAMAQVGAKGDQARGEERKSPKREELTRPGNAADQ